MITAYIAAVFLVTTSLAKDFISFSEMSLIENTMTIKVSNNGTHSRFVLTTCFDKENDLKNIKDKIWFAVGFNHYPFMVKKFLSFLSSNKL